MRMLEASVLYEVKRFISLKQCGGPKHGARICLALMRTSWLHNMESGIMMGVCERES
jgi:hypothetical protein